MTSTVAIPTDTITTVSGSVWTIEYAFGQTFVTRQPADAFGLVTEHDGQRVPCEDAFLVNHGTYKCLHIVGGPLDRTISGFVTAVEEG